ncbi:MAG TPA: phosphoribosylformylglycinamidine cyclo-ligase [Polyangia bacterium]|jgi:phosphoribosylformylglycinamidine cyclo-ligase
MGLSYREAGVDRDAGDALVERIKPLVRATMRPEVVAGVGGFAALCGLPARYRDPLLVSGTDGVGTKLKVAFRTGRHDTIGLDLVAMCVNDVVTCGAEPLFFLDYFATGALAVGVAEQIIGGIARGCVEAGCALVGGETAELPGMYAAGEYDLAGFCVGVVERDAVLDGRLVRPGDRLVGVASSGLHSNGYSLAQKVLLEHMALPLDARPAELGGATVGDALLTPTFIYAKLVAALRAAVEVHGFAHITGGGLPGNAPRMLGPGLALRFRAGSWPVPPIFDLIAHGGGVDPEEMRLTFNLGLGLVAALPAAAADRALEVARAAGHAAFVVGEVVAAGPDTPEVAFT